MKIILECDINGVGTIQIDEQEPQVCMLQSHNTSLETFPMYTIGSQETFFRRGNTMMQLNLLLFELTQEQPEIRPIGDWIIPELQVYTWQNGPAPTAPAYSPVAIYDDREE